MAYELKERRPAAKVKRLFTDVQLANIVLKRQNLVEQTLEKRLAEPNVKLEDLFMIVPALQNAKTQAYEEGDQQVETKFGKLRVFMVGGLTRSYILHKDKFPYPKTKYKGNKLVN